MKKIVALLLTALLVFALAACSGSSESGSSGEPAATETPAPPTPAEDNAVMGMSFTIPEGYKTVERNIEKTADGTLVDKSFTYAFDDESQIIIGYTYGKELTDAVPQDRIDNAETAEYDGKSFYIIEEGKTKMALSQDDKVIYGIGYTFADAVDNEKFDDLMSGISFTGATATEEGDDSLYDIQYSLDDCGNVLSTDTVLTVFPDGETDAKSVSWKFGEDLSDPDYRFLIRVYKNSTVEEQLDSDKEYEEQEINGVTFTVIKPSTDDKPYSYFTQHGSDVYKIYNSGSGGWFSTRSEECTAAFEALINSISFK